MTSTLNVRLMQQADAARRIEIITQELCPPEPQLLDTCVLQNLGWVERQIESLGSVMWDDEAVANLTEKYGVELANDLIDIGILYTEFENRSGYPWLVSRTAHEEASHANGDNGARLLSLLSFFRDYQDDWPDETYPGIAKGLLFARQRIRVSPLLLRGLGVTSVDEIYSTTGPLAFLPDKGDRMITAEALVANVPILLTTDRATFWKHRVELSSFGLAVMRPTELLRLYKPYWKALDEEFLRRSCTQR